MFKVMLTVGMCSLFILNWHEACGEEYFIKDQYGTLGGIPAVPAVPTVTPGGPFPTLDCSPDIALGRGGFGGGGMGLGLMQALTPVVERYGLTLGPEFFTFSPGSDFIPSPTEFNSNKDLKELCEDYPLSVNLEGYVTSKTARSGSFKTIYFTRSSDPTKPGLATSQINVSIDAFDRGAREIERLSRMAFEARVLKKLSGIPHLLQTVGVSCREEDHEMLISHYTPLYENGTLAVPKTPLSINEKLRVVQQVCEAMAGIHARGMAHRDIKPGNIFITKNPPLDKVEAVLGDVGEVYTPDDMPAWFNREGGSRSYWPRGLNVSAPHVPMEATSLSKHFLELYQRQDCWALGQSLVETLQGSTLPSAKVPLEAYEAGLESHIRDVISLVSVRHQEGVGKFLRATLKVDYHKIDPHEVHGLCAGLHLDE